jgi:hypothetical protein
LTGECYIAYLQKDQGTETLKPTTFASAISLAPEILPYAILSHTWREDKEVPFKDLADGTAKRKPGYAELQFCGNQAGRHGLKFFWVDTCCIDKSDDVEP